MTRAPAAAPTAEPPRFARRFWPVFTLGLIGIATLPLKLGQLAGDLPLPPALADWPPGLVIALGLLNPLLMLLVTGAIGAALAHRVGLGSAIAGTLPNWPSERVMLQSLLMGLVLAGLIQGLDALWAGQLGAGWQSLRGQSQSVRASDLMVGLLYGGLTEEVLLRWGVMSLLAWGLFALWRRLPGQRESSAAVPIGIAVVLAAALFALGHLPALAAAVELTPAIVARTLTLNLLAGLVYGWQFWRHGLEAAMLAHMATHVGFFGFSLLV